MEDMDDDFGDLYADVEVQLSSAFEVSNFNQLYLTQENQNERSSNAEGDHNLNKVVLAIPKDEKPFPDVSKELVMEGNGEKDLILDNGSDSEDDFHIVLNEEDCRKYPVPHDSNARNVGMVEGSEDEDGSKDKKWVEKAQLLSDGLEQSSAERGNGKKGSYSSQYSQYKYIRPHATPLPNGAKMNGAGVAASFASPPSGKSDWNLSGSNRLVGSSPGVASPCTTFAVVSQGCDFSLPRYRTIFDVNIETFERKPWRQPGVDVTDFFNFGLDEDRWKHYCNCLEQIRQQATMPTRIPVYGPDQAFEAEFGHETVNPEILIGEVVPQNAIRGVRWQEIPKGRAIQVEGGIGERRPSMDVRRPRNRDSDVVIQIPVQDSKEFSSSSSKEEQGFLDNSMEGSENRGSDLDDNRDGHLMEVMDGYSRGFDPKDTGISLTRCSERTFCLDRGSQGNEEIPNADGYHHQKVAREYVFEEVTEAMETNKDAKDGANENFIKAGACASEAKSSLGNHIRCSYSPSFDSQSEASKDGDDIDMEDTRKLAKMPSLNSITGLPESVTSDFHDQKESGSNESKTGPQVRSEDQCPLQVEHNSRSSLRLRSVAELKIHSDDDEASPISDRKGWHDRNHLNGTRRERNISYDCKDREDLSLYRQTKISIDCSSGRFTKKQVRSAYTGIQRKEYPHFRGEVDPYLRKRRDEREYFLNKRDVCRDNEVMEREVYLCEKGHTNGGISGITHEQSMRSTSEHSSFHRDDERYHQQRRKRDDEYEFRKGIEVDDFVYEYRYKEEIYQDKYGRHVPYDGRERGYFQEKYDRNGPYIANEIERWDRRERYGGSPCSDLDDSWNFAVRDEECWRHSDHDFYLPYSHRGSHNSNERGYRYNTSPGSDLFDSRRSYSRRTADNWRQSEKHRNSSWFDPRFKDHEDADRAVYPDDHGCTDRRKYIWQSSLAVDNLSSRRQSRGRLHGEEASFSCERSLRQDYIHVENDLARGEMLLHQYPLERGRNRTIREERRNFEVKDEQTELRWRNSVDLQLVGWEGKSSGSSKVMAPWCNRRNNNIDDDEGTFRRSDKLYSRKFVPHHLQKFESNYSNGVNSKVDRVGLSHIDHHTEEGNEKLLEKHPVSQQRQVAVVREERQLEVEDPETKKIALNGDAREKILNPENVVKHENQRILDTLARMEKRRERFKESISLKKEPDKNPMPQSDVVVEEPTEVKQMRPARKRRWGGN